MDTIKNNRNTSCPLMPDKTLENKNLITYGYFFDEKNEITIVKWKENKCVTIETNFDYIEPLTEVSRHEKGLKEKSQILQPSTPSITEILVVSAAQYNKNMGGVGQHDWFLEKHTIQIRAKNGTG